MTLGSWFRSYVYIPLGGNRCSKLKNVRNLLVVWGLTGLWHGASWNFVIWGLYFGIILILEKFIYGKALEKLPSVLQHIYSLILIVFGWVLFEMNSIETITGFLSALLGFNGAGAFNSESFYLVASNIVIFALCFLFSSDWSAGVSRFIKKKNKTAGQAIIAVGSIAVFAVCICYMATSQYNPFLYLNF